MNFKRFHESENLFDKDNADTYQAYFPASDYWMATDSDSISVKIPCKANTQYTLSIPISESGSIFRIYESNDINAVPAFTNPPMLSRIIRAETTKTYTFTTSATAECIVFQGSYTQRNVWLNGLMFNEGEYLPYEPYSSEVWHDIPHYIHKTATDTLSLPAVIYPNDTSITVGIKGQSNQSGTPSSQSPVDVNGVGERTGNLFDGTLLGGYYVSANYSTSGDEDVFKSIKVYLPAGTYTFSWGKNVNVVRMIIDGTYSQGFSTNISSYIITSNTDDYVGISFRDTTSSSTAWDVTTPIMLNTGSTPLPYEPYGIKIPISCGGTTTPVYLGEVQTTRQIKKLVLTGSESEWGYVGEDATRYFRLVIGNLNDNIANMGVCSHYTQTAISSSTTNVGFTIINSGSQNKDYLAIRPDNAASTSLADFKSYLAQQYANGTPVTVWYVLATEETAVVNEPLMKIDSYSDSLTTSIPCTAGENSIDVQTTVAPSEVTATWTGWHNASVKEKSENLFDISTATIGKYIDNNGNEQTSSVASPIQRLNHSDYFPVSPNTTYTFSSVKDSGVQQTVAFVWYTSEKTFISRTTEVKPVETTDYSLTATSPNNAAYAIINYTTANNEVMLNTGSEALPYEPYWK